MPVGRPRLLEIQDELRRGVARLRFAPPVSHVYNPLAYAWAPYERYLRRFGRAPRPVLLLGMNPGPFGMTQTGVPFGEVAAVRDWMGIHAPVEPPRRQHPKRPVLGFECPRSEVSGRRLWGFAQSAFGSPEAFFERFFVANYCPLVFLEESGRNRVPERLPRAERERLFAVCDRALRRTVEHFEPQLVVGIGRFAEERLHAVLGDAGPRIGRMPHPSPASPAANRGWEAEARQALEGLGVALGTRRQPRRVAGAGHRGRRGR